MRRAGVAVVAGMLALALAGCVGIPTAGGVNDGAIINDQDSPEFVPLPSDPIPGSSQQQILIDFMQAVSAPQGGYSVAKKYLTTEFAQTWNPDASAIIRVGGLQIDQLDARTVSYTISSRASVNELGQYQEERETSEQPLTFVFAQEKGEWRISQAADGIVLSQSAFNVAFREQALYFFDPSYAFLVPDVRWFPSRQTASNRVVTALLSGPSSWLQQAVTTAFPDATTLGEIAADASGTTVDLSTEALTSTPQDRDRMRQQLVATLGTPNVSLTVRGLELATPDATGNRAVVNPTVDSAVLVGANGTAFGLDGGTGVTPITGLSDQVVAAGATAADLSSDRQSVAFLGAGGVVFVALAGDDKATVIDDRPDLTVPAVDPFRFIWSAQRSSAASLATFDLSGDVHEIQSGLPADASIVSMDVSRDGARLLLLLTTPVGPRLIVAGIIRQDNVPIKLGEPIELPVGAEPPLDATWVDNKTVATVASDEAGALITAFEIGGPSISLGRVQGAVAIVGGNGGTDGLRVLASDGNVWRPRGSEGWVATGITATFLATKQ
ncbi:MAG: GerMN domain-containing protein [Salinibacterium sp.]|nr:GerMN domain-containing protein [Salinibacterium sp.]